MSFYMIFLRLLVCIWGIVAQKKVEESNTGALLTFPSVFDGPLHTKEWEVAPAQFGYQSYGGSIEAYLVISKNTTYHTECPEKNAQEPLNKNEYIEWLKVAIDTEEKYGFIMVIDRGDCYFVEKVELAQSLGAKACIIVDHTPEHLFTMWMPDVWNDDIDIPSVLLGEKNGEILYQHLGVKNWDPKHIEKTTYPAPPKLNWTLATIEWGLPHDDDRVEWELWTSSNDPLAMPFKRNFKPISLLLDGSNDTVFEPRMYILNGSHWGCNSPPYLCGNQCSNQGRYCSVDPEYDLEEGISGIDVVQENLRNLCVWNYTKYKDELNHNLNESTWWDYAVMWDENCANPTNISEFKFTEVCSFGLMDSIDSTGKLKQYVIDCISNSGGYGSNDTINTILDNEVQFRERNSIYAMPMVRVNEFLIHGNIDCEELTIEGCEVLAAICAGFLEKTEPEICKSSAPTSTPTIAPTLRPTFNPIQGECQIDACGDCKFLNDPTWDSCRGCDGIINSGKKINPCGICMPSNSSIFYRYGKDCNNICDGTAEYDLCNNCLDPSNSNFNSCINQGSNNSLDLKLIIIVAAVVLIIVIIIVLVFIRMKKKQQSLESKLSQLAGSSYEFMNDDPQATNVNVTGKTKQSKVKKVAVRTDEEEDQVL